MGDQPFRKAATYTGQHEQRIKADIHASSGIITNDPIVWAVEDIICLRPSSHCNRLVIYYNYKINEIKNIFDKIRLV
jgi:hypothetical protein